MNRDLILRSSAILALCLTGLASCSDDDGDDDNNETTAVGNNMASAGSDMGTGSPMSFFVSSVSGPDGGNFGGLSGADEFCSGLAEAAGSTGQTWKALLSTDTEDAKDRIGVGPWYNADSVMIADSLSALFTDGIEIGPTGDDFDADTDPKRALLLDETGAPVSATPNEHDILTGSNPDGTAADATCLNWTSGAVDDAGQVGHSDSRGPQGDNVNFGWVSSHASRGCDLASLQGSGGAGLIYCFAE